MDAINHAKKGDLKFLKEAPLDILLNARDSNGDTVLSIVVKYDHLDCCEVICKRCPSLLYHQTRQGGNTPLHSAAHSGNLEIARLLIKADPHFSYGANSDGKTPLLRAIEKAEWDDDREMLELILELQPTQSMVSVNKDGWTALHFCLSEGYLDAIGCIIQSSPESSKMPDNEGQNFFHHAVKFGNEEMVKEILRMEEITSTVFNSLDNWGRTPSDVAAASRNESIILCLCEDPRVNKKLTMEDKLGDTALHKAVLNNKLEEVKLLVETGQNNELLRACNNKNNTPLHLAVKQQKSSLEIARLLIEADPDLLYGANSDGKTPLLCAIEKAEWYDDREMLELILKLQPSQSMVSMNEDGWTALHFCVSEGYLDAIGCIIHSCPESSKVADSDGQNFFHHAVKLGNLEMVKEILGMEEITPTVLNSPDNLGRRPWDVAAASRNESIILCLHEDPRVNKKLTMEDEAVKLLVEAGPNNELLRAGSMMDQCSAEVYDSIASSLSKLASDKPHPYSRAQLKEFTKDFSHPLGSGGFGDVYKGQFPDGVFIAVKVLKNTEYIKEKVMIEQFKAEVNTMGRAYHCNLIKLYGYCYDSSTKYKALVYDYMENGSFDKILFEKNDDIPWAKLHNIAKEIAQGISYLHESCKPQIIHQDIKPANVLLDSNLSPKIIDFGLAKVSTGESQFEQTSIKGSRGYMAPEINQLQKVQLSNKVDVYSFGMMMFDILGSKRNHVDKRRWFPGQVWEMYKAGQLEKFILECGIKEEDKKNAERLATIALLCVEHNPKTRPKLSNVVKMLEGEIKQLETPIVPFSRDYIYSSEICSMSYTMDD